MLHLNFIKKSCNIKKNKALVVYKTISDSLHYDCRRSIKIILTIIINIIFK